MPQPRSVVSCLASVNVDAGRAWRLLCLALWCAADATRLRPRLWPGPATRPNHIALPHPHTRPIIGPAPRVKPTTRARRALMWAVFGLMGSIALVATAGSVESIAASAKTFTLFEKP